MSSRIDFITWFDHSWKSFETRFLLQAFNVKATRRTFQSDGGTKLTGGAVSRGKHGGERDVRFNRSESQGNENSKSRSSQVASQQITCSVSFDSASDSIFEPETEAGLYDDDPISDMKVGLKTPSKASRLLAEKETADEVGQEVICIELDPPTPTSEDSPPFDSRVVAYQTQS